jgi:hypothetical protein
VIRDSFCQAKKISKIDKDHNSIKKENILKKLTQMAREMIALKFFNHHRHKK